MSKNILYKSVYLFSTLFLLFSCASKPVSKNQDVAFLSQALDETSPSTTNDNLENQNNLKKINSYDPDEITLLFAGDIMAHNINYAISDVNKIYKDVKDVIIPCDFAFANIESPIDTTQKAQTYPNFNMTQSYVQAAIDAGFNVFSLCNNHTNDQYLNGIKETSKTVDLLKTQELEKGNKVYFSGIKDSEKADYTFNLIKHKNWRILFLPITEILNRQNSKELINYIATDKKSREKFISYVKELKKKNRCDLFILSIHAAEPEYTRAVTESQEEFYQQLLTAGVDIIWANHAHIIKNRKYIYDTKTGKQKVIMYANGNTISGQRTNPDFTNKKPIGERDNTGDGVMVKITMTKNKKKIPQIKKAENIFITTYINTAWEYVIKKLDEDFVNYLYSIPRKNWAEYIKRRISINKEYTKDLIEWQ